VIPRHKLLPDEDLMPTYVPVGESATARAAAMRELHKLSNRIPQTIRERDELLLAYATSQSLSRRDMATACGLTEGRVQQILTELSQRDQRIRNARAAETTGRHTAAPDGAPASRRR